MNIGVHTGILHVRVPALLIKRASFVFLCELGDLTLLNNQPVHVFAQSN